MAAYSAGAPAPPALNLLASAKRVWSDVGPEIKASVTWKEGPLLPPEELKKACKYLQSTVTKFSASATVVADAEEAQRSLTPIAEEVMKAFTILLGTLLSISSGAGTSLARELKEAGETLTEALNTLGMAVCTGSLAASAGKVLEHAAALERSSTQNRAALMRRLLKSLAQLRDANREMQEELDTGECNPPVDVLSGDEELLEDDDDLSLPAMDPSERTLLENVLSPFSMGDRGGTPPTHTWRVIGGTENGLLVREQADLTSPERGRLSHGALLLQKELRGDRLGFQLLRGSGPSEGYVSIKIKGKELLERCQPESPETHIPHVSLEVDMPKDCMTTLLNFRRVANFRDVADSTGGKLRSGKLFRSGHFAAALPEDLDRLEALGVRTYVDLRDGLDFEGADAPVYDIFPPSPRESLKFPSSIEQTEQSGKRRRIWCPFSIDLKLRSWTAEEKHALVPQGDRKSWNAWWYQRYVRIFMEKKVEINSASNLCALNRAILLINSQEVLKAMKALTDEKNYPLVFGCVAGKDRTGLLACLLLSALGMDKETIMGDYLKTNLAAEHINACVQVGLDLWWKQLEN
eukprot:symbB.v1.2.010348.t1/scaffold675.1/size173442/6